MELSGMYPDGTADVVNPNERELPKTNLDNTELSRVDSGLLNLQDIFSQEFLSRVLHSQDASSQDIHSHENLSLDLQSQDVLSEDFPSNHPLSQVYFTQNVTFQDYLGSEAEIIPPLFRNQSHHSPFQTVFPQDITFQDRLALEAEMESPLFQEDASAVASTLPGDNQIISTIHPSDETPAILSASSYFSQYGIASPFAVPLERYTPDDTSRDSETSQAELVRDPDFYPHHETTSEASEEMPEITKFLHEEATDNQQANVDNNQEVEVTGFGSQQILRPSATLRPVAPPPAYQASHWTNNEKKEFMRLLSIHGMNWDLIAANMPANTKGKRKTNKAVQSYYVRSVADNKDTNMETIGLTANQSNNRIHGVRTTRVPRFSNWTAELRTEFLRLLRTHGRKWALIAAEMSSLRGKAQSATTVSNYYHHCVNHGDLTVRQIADAAEMDREEEEEEENDEQEDKAGATTA